MLACVEITYVVVVPTQHNGDVVEDDDCGVGITKTKREVSCTRPRVRCDVEFLT